MSTLKIVRTPIQLNPYKHTTRFLAIAPATLLALVLRAQINNALHRSIKIADTPRFGLVRIKKFIRVWKTSKKNFSVKKFGYANPIDSVLKPLKNNKNKYFANLLATTVKSTLKPVKNKINNSSALTLEMCVLEGTTVYPHLKNFKSSQLPIDCPLPRAVNTLVHRLGENNEEVTWQQGHLHFVLQSDDPCVVRRAGDILRYWQPVPGLNSITAASFCPVESATADFLTCSMTVTRLADGWQFTGSQPDTPAAVYRDMTTVIRAAETDAALAILNHPRQFLTVHGALLAHGDEAVLIVGPSQSGKSTTSCALWAAGWQLLADDVSILSPDDATASPLLRRVSLRHPSRDLLGDDFWNRMVASSTCDPTPEGYVFHPDEIEGQSRARSARLCAIIFLRRLNAADPGPACLSPITPASALLALAPYTNVVHHGGMGEAISRLAPLLNQVPCYDMGRGPLPAMTATIRTLVRQEAALERL